MHQAEGARREGVLLARIVTAVALFAALLVAAGAPLGHFYLLRSADLGRLEGDANVRAFQISQAVSANPHFWRFEAHAIEGILSRSFHEDEVDYRAVVDPDGTALYEYGSSALPWPVLSASSPVYDSGQVVARVEERHSSRHILPSTGLVAIVSVVIGAIVFFAVRMFPMRALEQAWKRATHDPLTGLPNRLLLADRIQQAADISGRSDTSFAVHCLDLDRFKEVNDTLGHSVGDLLLQEASQRMIGCLRKGDTLARIGGDEFVLLQAGVLRPEDAAGAAERLIAVVSKPFELKGHNVLLTTSVGIALFEGNGQSTNELLQNADNALYTAKAAQRGSFRFFDKALNERLDARITAERELRAGLAAGQFQVLYQPLISLPETSVTGVEALVRWNHPTRGLVTPDAFIPLAEDTGLIVPLGEWVLRTACAQAATWKDINLAVNVSPVQFRHGRIVETVKDALAAAGLPPERLELEITEGLLISDTAATLRILNELRELGVRIVMDDFGTGYSSLAYLRKFPFDKIKLDKSFVRDLGENPDADAIAHTIIDLARTLKITANAEGVESKKQLEWLVGEGCGEAQGYLFARPLPQSDLNAFLAAFKRSGKSGAEHPVEGAPQEEKTRRSAG